MLLEKKTFYNDKRIAPSEKYKNYKHIYIPNNRALRYIKKKNDKTEARNR